MKQFTKLPITNDQVSISTFLRYSISCLMLAALLSACWKPSLPDLPSIPKELGDPGQVLKDMGLGDLTEQFSDINLTLPDVSTPPGAINFNGPTAVNVGMGESIPGTNLKLTAINDQGAEFEIAGLRSLRKIGDSLDFDGSWPQLNDVSYTMRLRIFYIGSSSVRAAGVHRLLIPNIAPQVAAANLQLGGYQLKFTFVDNVNLNESIAGTTLVYAGEDSRGGIVNGLPAGTYNFFKVGDSLSWIGLVRNQIGAQYDLRMIFYTASNAQLGGTVTVAMPTK